MTGLGAKGLEDYEPPSVRLAGMLAGEETVAAAPLERGEDRQLAVAALVAQLGGEAG